MKEKKAVELEESIPKEFFLDHKISSKIYVFDRPEEDDSF